MWIRVTCPNGHALQSDRLERAARSKRCPDCGAKVSMWTRIQCPNGHTLKVRTKHGGASGTCPQCKEPVEIPAFDIEHILDVLLPDKGRAPVIAAVAPVEPVAAPQPKPVVGPKHLAQFSWEMFDKKPAARAQSLNCPHCGTIGFPGQKVCSTCGQAALVAK